MALLKSMIVLFLLASIPLSSSFLLHQPPHSEQRCPPSKQGVLHTAAVSRWSTKLFSFYDKERRAREQAIQQAQEAWSRRFQEVLIIQGQDLCVAGYEGYLRTGSKGAVVVHADADPGPQGYPIEFRALETFLAEPDDKLSPEEKEALVQMVTGYDPEAELPVMFEYQGQRGVNVLRPTFPPRQIFESTRRK